MDWKRLLIASLLAVAFMTLVNQVTGQDATSVGSDTATAGDGGESSAVTQSAYTSQGAADETGAASAGPGATTLAVDDDESTAAQTSAALTAAPGVEVTGETVADEGVTTAEEQKSTQAATAGDDATTVRQTEAAEETTADTTSAVTDTPGAVTTKTEAEETTQTQAPAVVTTEAPKPTLPPRKPDAVYKVTTIPVPPYLMVNESAGGYQGYIVDLLEKMKIILNVDFEINLVADGKFGKEVNGEWNGMIGEVIRQEADLAAAPLTVTSARDAVVDFTQPIMSISAAAIIMKRHPLRRPKIDSLQDMVDNDFRFGVLQNSNIFLSLNMSNEEKHKKILQSIEKHDGLKISNDDGIPQARWDSKYAFLIESSSADYAVSLEPCILKAIPTDIYKRKYAFAIRNQSPLRDIFNRALTDLQVLNALDDLKQKWFKGAECSGSFISSSVANVFALIVLTFYMLK